MRKAGLIVALWAWASVAVAQAPAGDGWRPYRFGMSEEEVRAASPRVEWQRSARAGWPVSLQAQRNVEFGGRFFDQRLSFGDNRLNRIVFSMTAEASSATQCAGAFRRVVEDVERSAGPLHGSAAQGEYGALARTEATRSGSQLRFYDDRLVPRYQRGYANRNDAGFVEVASRFAPTRVGSSAFTCQIEIEFHAEPTPAPSPLTPPTRAALDAATLIESPNWVAMPTSRAFELNYPPVALEQGLVGRVDLDCLVIENGALNCAVAAQMPRDWHFGQAALNISRAYRIAAEQDGASTLGRRVRIPVAFSTTGSAGGVAVSPHALEAMMERAPTPAELAEAELLTDVQWVARPNAANFARFFPIEPLSRNVDGRAVLDCLIEQHGFVRCAVAEEEPGGQGFGVAAVAVAHAFLAPTEIDGQSTLGKRVRVTIMFRVG